ncbi:MAG: hypothetical protein A3G47_00615 [Candidatus Zambryskibacteria bacterium RIFCSPLOWO2_12_FULL_39_45]|uniref:Uncharacterized protein n=1 Tax=Candidatus Zambryskibacteria bacterium RIFCSPHIGHO2_02_38_10.5 TaxID=1802742 RepID=A0A1G2T6K5_9BACT|nr:MAG: hypothetical protein UT81_C0013G0022 [Parcubacteria group bacterium GW2011_GWA2_40_14]OHA92905.1 MAG: hypothetical protein A2W58_00105 [Candidatus Zambryskibacteria bacterium RIFCSPHIGHO2_02_38_10.5]OHA96212.1 MAG: hypothetical protein A3C63_02675 [Candidatus Zambryskibacteria bacterium RIFCSPHIGHO2_02_FULL_39_82]OHB09188.1 MAG: hypothetical protein A2W64_01455 [Candidatus Zambryskibacteria bacterium RIFCSPLOWO2_02_39_10]OHB10758.1 MAG: hypothetical protein A3I21_02815 [Candidatus Zambr
MSKDDAIDAVLEILGQLDNPTDSDGVLDWARNYFIPPKNPLTDIELQRAVRLNSMHSLDWKKFVN